MSGTPGAVVVRLLTVVVLAAACAGPGDRASHAGPDTGGAVGRPLVRQFWFGGSDGDLFRIDLHRVTQRSSGGTSSLVLDGEASNLLRAPARFDVIGELLVGSRRYPVTATTRSEVAGGSAAPVRFAAERLPGSVDPSAAVLVLGAPGTNRTTVPLDARRAVSSTPPSEDVLPTTMESLPTGATFRVTRSVRFPRYSSGTEGQQRLTIFVDVDMTTSTATQLMLHPSLTSPDGTTQSVGDQVALPPRRSFSETAILNPPVRGTYQLTLLEMTTLEPSTLSFAIP